MVPYLPLPAACGEPQVVTPDLLDRMTNREENLLERSLMRDDMAATWPIEAMSADLHRRARQAGW
jgi:hypothetical protein